MVPVKALPAAKSRLAATVTDPGRHADLVRAIRADTIAAASQAAGVARILVVTDRPGGTVDEIIDDATTGGVAPVEILIQDEPGLNPALLAGAAHAHAHWPHEGVAALVGDLPALQPAELAAALTEAAGYDTAFVPDADGIGTTLLTAVPSAALRPEFGVESAARHGRQAHRLAGSPGLRHDVDTKDDLIRALALGVGPRTGLIAAAVTSCSR